MERQLIVTGNINGIKMSVHHKAYFNTGAEWWARILVGNIPSNKKLYDFAKEQIVKIKELDSIIVNGEKIK